MSNVHVHLHVSDLEDAAPVETTTCCAPTLARIGKRP
jgi:hypothetical protein